MQEVPFILTEWQDLNSLLYAPLNATKRIQVESAELALPLAPRPLTLKQSPLFYVVPVYLHRRVRALHRTRCDQWKPLFIYEGGMRLSTVDPIIGEFDSCGRRSAGRILPIHRHPYASRKELYFEHKYHLMRRR